MTRDVALSLLRQGNTGDSILQILETIAGDAPGFAYVESPMMEQVLGIPTAEPIQF